ncbi:MAG: Flavin reductase, partial [Brevundimonas sp.]|nr:Flavin reductase [Brevundimonas sp.]
MAIETYRGFGGVALSANTFGWPDDPIVILVHSGGQSGAIWRETAIALANAGRYVVCPDLRGHGDSGRPEDGRYDLEAYVEDLRAILAALPARPVVVGAALGGAVALAALSGDGQALATGLVIAGIAPELDVAETQSFVRSYRNACGDADPRWTTGLNIFELKATLEASAAQLKLPMLVIQGSESRLFPSGSLDQMRRLAPATLFIEIEGADHTVASDRPEVFQAHLLEFLETRAPRAPATYQIGSDARTLRDALGCFGTGVTIVTTTGREGEPVGLTANSLTSVSLDPPLLLFCLARNAGSLPAFEAADTFAVNVLHIG